MAQAARAMHASQGVGSRPLAARPACLAVSTARPRRSVAVRSIDIDFSNAETQVSAAGVVLGLLLGIGAPVFYINRMEKDEERLEGVRALNRANFEQTGEYMDETEIAKIRPPKWTDRKEWQDDD